MKFLRSPVSKNSPQEFSKQIEPVLVSCLISEIHKFLFTSNLFLFSLSLSIYFICLFVFLFVSKERITAELIGTNILGGS